MSLHHLALATRDTAATHAFYSGVMGFHLARVEVTPTPAGGWAKHLFYEMPGGGMIAFWELHDATLPTDFPTALSEGLGLPPWVNHIAFTATDLDDLARRRDAWLEADLEVLEIDHDWCRSVYTRDPGGTLVEFCVTTRALDKDDAAAAARLRADPAPAISKIEVVPILHRRGKVPLPLGPAADTWSRTG